jgi:glycosyltransferase involved in cell wall biosynthesis
MSSHSRQDVVKDGPHVIENRPKARISGGGGVLFHISSIAYGLGVVLRAVRERARVVVVDSGTTHWIVLSLLPMLRIPVIAVLHNALWPAGFRSTRNADKLFRRVDGLFFRRFASATLCVSPECERQVREIAGKTKGPICQFRPQYRTGFLDQVRPAPDLNTQPFNVLFMGRIEEVKGVFLILALATRLEEEMPGRFRWKVAGEGGSAEKLRRQIVERGLGHLVELTGSIKNEDEALDTFGWSHAMLVPTTSRFAEGLAMTAVEGVLAGRPVVVSSVVPAGEILGDAAIRAKADDVASFDAIFRRLALDSDYYDLCSKATATARGQFYKRSEGLGEVLGRAIAAAV